jgi:hypothetical protein
MKPEDKKKIIEWLGWGEHTRTGILVQKGHENEIIDTSVMARGRSFRLEDWNPSEDANCWPEIWERIFEDANLQYAYLTRLGELLCKPKGINIWSYHTCPLDIRCKALLEVINV